MESGNWDEDECVYDESVRTKVRTRMSVREDVFMGWEKEERPPL